MSGVVERAPSISAGAASRRRGWLTLKQGLLGVAAAIVTAAAATYAVQYWQVGRYQIETDDAYVQADSIIIAPRVAGYISAVAVNDNQPVKAGQILARIDDRDLRTALDQSIADREAAAHKVANLGAQLQLQQSLIDQAKAQLASAQAAASFAAEDQKRYSDLARTGAGSVQQAQQTQSLLIQRAADVQRAQATLTSAEQQVEVLRTGQAEAQAAFAHAQAVEQQARLNLSYATIVAPQDGTVGARTLRVGQYVQAGTQLMAIVPLNGVYVVANYKETQLTDVRPGQPEIGRAHV